jgi:hypothetical protein
MKPGHFSIEILVDTSILKYFFLNIREICVQAL